MRTAFILSILSLISSISFAGGAGTVGPGSPAALFCMGLKSESVTIKHSNGGESGLCVVDGAAVADFTLLWELKYKIPQEALTVFIEHPAAQGSTGENPSSQYCVQVGGALEIVFAKSSNKNLGLCRFSDRSAIEVETLYRGPSSPENKKLTELLLLNLKN
ncbi:MAG: DUF333 domain-containing protein [Bdellovibrio sp.]